MKLVVLGAGASFDSCYDFFDGKDVMPWRPPLANELLDTRQEFRNIIESYPGGRFYLSQLNGISDIEDFFQKQWHFLKNNRAEDLAAHFINLNYCLSHLMYKISNEYSHVGPTNYDVLIQKAYEYAISSKEDVLIVSFNYDVLLEYSFSKLYYGNRKGITIDEYIKYPIKIFKPHGSCNWFKRFKKQFIANDSISTSDYLFNTKTSLRAINQNLEESHFTLDNPIGQKDFGEQNQVWNCFPQLLIPLKDKDDFVLPAEHEKCLKDNISKVSEILIVGWKGTEYKFQELLKNTIGNKKVKVKCVNAGYKGIEQVISKSLSLSEISHFEEAGTYIKYDNTKITLNDQIRIRYTHHAPGSFSAYTIKSMKNAAADFFKF